MVAPQEKREEWIARQNVRLRRSRPRPYHRGMTFLAQSAADVPVPLSTGWASALLLTILWIFAAAAIAGILLRFFQLDDRPSPTGENHA